MARNRNSGRKTTDAIRDAVALQVRLGLSDAIIRGDGYEALVTRNGIVVGRVYIGTVDEVEGS